MKSVIAEIFDWVSGLDFWEQEGFDLIVSGKDIEDGDSVIASIAIKFLF